MSSHFSGAPPRHLPCQKRGRKRVERLLHAAEHVIAESGYDAATMSAIARRGRSSVGSLYQFFPNKDAVADALRAGYLKEFQEFWSGLRPEGPALATAELVTRLLGFPIACARRHPAFLALLELPPTAHSQQRRGVIRDVMVQALRAGRPGLSRHEATRMAAVTQQIIRGCLTLYARSDIEHRRAVVDEFQTALSGYLQTRLGESGLPAPRKRPRKRISAKTKRTSGKRRSPREGTGSE